MKRLKLSILVLGLVLILRPSLWVSAVAPAEAVGVSEEIIGFQTLGMNDISMFSPYDSNELRFSLPEYWQLQEASELVLDFSLFISGTDARSEETSVTYGGVLSVEFNGTLIQSIMIDTTLPNRIRIPLPLDSLVSQRSDGRHVLSISLLSEISCSQDVDVSLVIKDSSFFVFSYKETALPLDLSLLPRPFYLRDAYLQIPTVIVVPDLPSQTEAKSMLTVAAGLGSATGSAFEFDVVTVSGLTKAQQTDRNLIFVGLPDAFLFAGSLDLPAPLNSDEFEVSWAEPDDGILQIVESPWNPNRVVLFISGNSETALLKAAHAFSTSDIMVMDAAKNLAIIKDVSLFEKILDSPVQLTFEDLGYDTFTRNKFGESALTYDFYVSQAQVDSTEAFIDLHYNYSSVLDDQLSSILVTINDFPIATLHMDSEVLGDVTSRISIPRNVLRVGRNQIEVRLTLVPAQECSALMLSNIWGTIYNDSEIYLPLSVNLDTADNYLNLRLYPEMLLENSSLNGISFVMPDNSPSAWNAASKIAFYFGHKAYSPIVNLDLNFGTESDETLLNSDYLVFVGRASELPILVELNPYLPAYFEPGSDIPKERSLLVSYRSRPDADIGYVELSHSPWADGQIVLGVFGTTDVGLLWAIDSLTNDARVNELNGDFAVVTETQIQTTNTLLLPSEESYENNLTEDDDDEFVPVVDPAPSTPTQVDEFSWVLPLLIVTVVVLFGFLLLLYYLSIFRRRKEQKELKNLKASFDTLDDDPQ